MIARVKIMRYISLVILNLILLLFYSCQESEIPGLVVRYSFDTNAMDVNNNPIHTEILNVQGVADRFGQNNGAYRFNGSNSVISADVSQMPPVDSPQSICLWFRIDTIPTFKHDLDAHNMIALVDTNAGVGIQFGFRATGYNSLGFDTWYWGGRTVMESDIPAVDEWHHCVYIFDGKQHLFYIDGKKSAESLAQLQTGTPDMLMLGNYPGGDQYFAGCIDDVRIYNRPLSQAEVQIIYTEEE